MRISFRVQTVACAMYVLIVLSSGPGMTLTEPYSARFLRQAMKTIGWPLAEGYSISDLRCRGHCPALLRSPQIHFTILACPSWLLDDCFLARICDSTEDCPFACGLKASRAWWSLSPCKGEWKPRSTASSWGKYGPAIHTPEFSWNSRFTFQPLWNCPEITAPPGFPHSLSTIHLAPFPPKVNLHFRACIWETCPKIRKHARLPV